MFHEASGISGKSVLFQWQFKPFFIVLFVFDLSHAHAVAVILHTCALKTKHNVVWLAQVLLTIPLS